MESIKVFLNTPQKNKMASGKSFQLSSTQLQADSGKHHVEIQMKPKNHKTFLKNLSNGKGYRFSADKIEGGGFLGNIAKTVAKTVGKKIAKKIAKKGLDAIGECTGQKGITNALKGSVDGLVDVGADKISGGKLTRGSPEMKEHMARLRGMRKGGGVKTEIIGEGVFEDLGRKIKWGFNKTFNPKLGRKIKGKCIRG